MGGWAKKKAIEVGHEDWGERGGERCERLETRRNGR